MIFEREGETIGERVQDVATSWGASAQEDCKGEICSEIDRRSSSSLWRSGLTTFGEWKIFRFPFFTTAHSLPSIPLMSSKHSSFLLGWIFFFDSISITTLLSLSTWLLLFFFALFRFLFRFFLSFSISCKREIFSFNRWFNLHSDSLIGTTWLLVTEGFSFVFDEER